MVAPNTNLTGVTSFGGQSQLQRQLAQFRNGQAIPQVTARNAPAAQPSVQQNIINSLSQGFDLAGNTLEAGINNVFSQSNIPQGFADTRRGLVQGQAVPPTFPAAPSAIPQANLNNTTAQGTVLAAPTPPQSPQSPSQGTGLDLTGANFPTDFANSPQNLLGGTTAQTDLSAFGLNITPEIATGVNAPITTGDAALDAFNTQAFNNTDNTSALTNGTAVIQPEASGGFFDNLEFGDIATGLNTLANVGGLFLGFEQLSLGQEQLAFQRDSFEAQFAEQRQLLQEARNRRSAITAAVAT